MMLSVFIFEMFSYSFIRYALYVGIAISVCASLLGVTMVLKKNSMIGDGLSHVAFGACAIATALNWAPLAVSIPVVMLASFLIMKLTEKSKLYGDSLIAIIASSSLAIGYIVIHASGTNVDIENYLYGSIYGITVTELVLSLVLAFFVIASFILFYNRIFAMTFDESFTKSTGGKTEVYSIVISLLCSLTVVLGMKIMGALLISSLIIFPAVSSRMIFKSYKGVVLGSLVISIVCFLIGMIINFYVDLPAGATIVVVNLVVLIIMMIIGKTTKRA